MRYLHAWARPLLAAALLVSSAPVLRAQEPAVPPAAPLRGDVDGDGRVTAADAAAVRAYLVRGTLPAGRAILPAGDANGDGRVTAADAALIARYAAGVDVSRFPLGRPIRSEGVNGGALLTLEYECTVDVAAKRTDCDLVAPSSASGGARLDVSLGSGPIVMSGSWVHSRGSPADEDTSTVTLAFTNKIPQPLGTTDGTTSAPNGNRLYFTTPPYVKAVSSGTVAGASIRLANAVDTADFVGSNDPTTWPDRPYYQFDGIVAYDATSSSKEMEFVYSANVTSFTYKYRIMATVQYEYGWITVSPATAPVLAPGDTTTLAGAVVDYTGQPLSDPISWSSSDTAVARVNASTGVVTGVAAGTATITATSTVNTQRTGTRVVTVDVAPTVSGTTPAHAATAVDPASNIVITFSEAVNVHPASFTLECSVGTSPALAVSGSGTAIVTLNPATNLPGTATCEVTVVAAQVSDADANDGPDTMTADAVFSFTVSNEQTWQGTNGGSWSDPDNWAGGVVPDSQSVVVLPASATNMPVLASNVVILDLEAPSGSTLDLGGFTLRARGDVTATGTISNGVLQLSGSDADWQGTVDDVVVSGAGFLAGATRATGPVSVTGSLSVADQALSISVP